MDKHFTIIFTITFILWIKKFVIIIHVNKCCHKRIEREFNACLTENLKICSTSSFFWGLFWIYLDVIHSVFFLFILCFVVIPLWVFCLSSRFLGKFAFLLFFSIFFLDMCSIEFYFFFLNRLLMWLYLLLQYFFLHSTFFSLCVVLSWVELNNWELTVCFFIMRV